MIDGRLSEFLDLLYMGEELVFEYHNVKYFLQGWSSEGQARMVLDILDKTGCLEYCCCIFHWFTGSNEDLTRALRAGCMRIRVSSK